MTTRDEKASDKECIQPPDQRLPAEVLGRYTLGHDSHEEAEIADYVNGQCRGDETVQYVELIKTEYVAGRRYDAWDVHTNRQRWWVLTNLTNLYSQAHFPSLDYTLSFHIGLMLRLQSHDDRGREPDPFDEVYRRRDEVADLIVRIIHQVLFRRFRLTLGPSASVARMARTVGA